MNIKKTLTWTFLFMLVVCIGAWVLFSVVFKEPRERRPFDINGWNAPMSDQNGFTGVRFSMVDDLLKQYDFHGWSATQVQVLLGRATYDVKEENVRRLKYDLRDGLKYLIFELNDQGKVIRYFLCTAACGS